MAVFRFEFGNLENMTSFLAQKPGFSNQHFDFQFLIQNFRFNQLLLRNLNSILVLVACLYKSVIVKLLSRTQTQTLKQTFIWVQTQNFKPENSHSLVYFNRPNIICHVFMFEYSLLFRNSQPKSFQKEFVLSILSKGQANVKNTYQ